MRPKRPKGLARQKPALSDMHAASSTVVRPEVLNPALEAMRLHDLKVHRQLNAALLIQAAMRKWHILLRKRKKRKAKGIVDPIMDLTALTAKEKS